MKKHEKSPTPTERLQSLLQWAINTDGEMEYRGKFKHFGRYLEKQYRKKLKKQGYNTSIT